MKYLYLTLLFMVVTPTFVRADEACNEAPVPDPVMFQALDQIVNRLEVPTDGVKFTGCGEDEELMKRSVAITSRMAGNLLVQVKAVQTSDPALRANLQKANTILSCIQRKLVSAKVSCKDYGGEKLGWAIPMIGTGIAIDQKFHMRRQSAYDWMNIDLESNIAATMLHEMSHKCGTNDRDYYDLPEDSLANQSSWADTADIYQNWAMWGFCAPGPECAARKPIRKGTPLASAQ